MKVRKSPAAIEICILAGGLSTRMGCEKSRVRLGTRTLLGHVRALARATGLPVRVIRRDIVPRCGPLGGVYTALATCRATAVLFLACDMPFVSPGLIRRILRSSRRGTRAVFTKSKGRCGFPFLLPQTLTRLVGNERVAGNQSLQSLARAARALSIPACGREVFNVNTPEDFARARAFAAATEQAAEEPA